LNAAEALFDDALFRSQNRLFDELGRLDARNPVRRSLHGDCFVMRRAHRNQPGHGQEHQADNQRHAELSAGHFLEGVIDDSGVAGFFIEIFGVNHCRLLGPHIVRLLRSEKAP
jgi:hypothetical protein